MVRLNAKFWFIVTCAGLGLLAGGVCIVSLVAVLMGWA